MSEFIVGFGLDYCYITNEPFIHVDLYHKDLWDDGNWPIPEGGRGTGVNPTQEKVIAVTKGLLADHNLTVNDVEFKVTDVWLRYAAGERAPGCS